MTRPRSALICHAGDELNEVGLARWMASFTDLAVIVRIHEPRSRFVRRLRRERQRIGTWRMLDVLAFRLVHTVLCRSNVRAWHAATLAKLRERFPTAPTPTVVDVPNANHADAVAALQAAHLDFAIARCKQLLVPRVFEAPRCGVFVLHPGICPEYRNAHGGFWALASDDDENVGSTLLRIDRGVDTGPVFGYYRTTFDAAMESPLVIQDRTLFDNLDAVQADLTRIIESGAVPIDTHGRKSGEWGQPWLTAWMRYRRRVRRRERVG